MSARLVAITDTTCCKNDFLVRIEALVQAGIDMLILREKHLCQEEYFSLAKEVLRLCKKYDVLCALHRFYEVALRLKSDAFHCPFEYRAILGEIRTHFKILGASIHSIEELKVLESSIDYAIVGHIFASKSKPNLTPKGLQILRDIRQSCDIDLFAIGGIELENLARLKGLGIQGVCMRSALMECENIALYVRQCKEILV